MTIQEESFGKTSDGKLINAYILSDGKGIEAKIINYGAILVSLKTPDRNGNSEDITLGYESVENYEKDTFYLGATIGRYANRIAKGKFTLDSNPFTLAVNDKDNHLHGGPKGFHKVVWEAEKLENSNSVGVKLTYLSRDGEEGYPGSLRVSVTYILTQNSELNIDFEAETDKKTLVNLTHHSYFNLTGSVKNNILNHELTLAAEHYTPVNESAIPTGEIKSVLGTDMDFTNSMAVGSRIDNVPGGYDHNYVLNKEDKKLTPAAEVFDPESGRVMEVLTTEPGIQFYSGNFLDGSITGKEGIKYDQHFALCLEPQHYPDSPNKPDFPSTVLNPGEKYKHITVFKFSTR
jgi:aldose 1-epimerase